MESSIRLSSIVIYRIVFAVIFAILSLAQATAKEHDHPVSGVVFDSFSEDGLPALITLMTADSVVIDTVRAVPGEYLFSTYPRAADYQFTVLMPNTLIDMLMQARELKALSQELKKNTASTYTGICDKLADLFSSTCCIK